MELVIWVAVFTVSLAVLVKASDFFVAGAEKVGRSLGLSSFIVGVVIVGIGTSLPELISSVIAVLEHHSEIVIGNAIGSNITNIFLILGVTAFLGKSFDIKYNLLRFDLPFLSGSALLISFMVWDRSFSMGEALLCVAVLVIYFMASVNSTADDTEKYSAHVREWLYLTISPVFIFLGAKYTIEAVVKVSEILSIGSDVIALSAVAFGTSLPELAVSVASVKKGKPEMAVGNIIGSNIFNTLGVMGLSRLVGELVIPSGMLDFSMPLFLAATFLYVIITVDQRISRNEGIFMILFYLFFIGKLYGFM